MENINVKELAKTSSIYIDENEEKLFADEIQSVIEFIGEYNLPSGISQEYKIIDFNELREDLPKESLTLEDALKNTYEKKYSYFQIKEFIEE